jgi:hypothetical protein
MAKVLILVLYVDDYFLVTNDAKNLLMKANQAWSLEFDLTNLGIVTHCITFGLEMV